mgnify:CR=1 FL=1
MYQKKQGKEAQDILMWLFLELIQEKEIWKTVHEVIPS